MKYALCDLCGIDIDYTYDEGHDLTIIRHDGRYQNITERFQMDLCADCEFQLEQHLKSDEIKKKFKRHRKLNEIARKEDNKRKEDIPF